MKTQLDKDTDAASITSESSTVEQIERYTMIENEPNVSKSIKNKLNELTSFFENIPSGQIIKLKGTTRTEQGKIKKKTINIDDIKELINDISDVIQTTVFEYARNTELELAKIKHDMIMMMNRMNVMEENQKNNQRLPDFPSLPQTNPVLLPTPQWPTMKEDHVLIIDTKDNEGAKEYRNELRSLKSTIFPSPPLDVILPRPNRLIIKMKDRKDLEILKNNLSEHETLNEKALIKENKILKNRMILFDIPMEYEENEEKLKIELENIPELNKRTIEVNKIFKTNKGNMNAIINVDNTTQQILLKKRKLLLDLVRINVAKYITLSICYNCQQFGHIAVRCRNKTSCAICNENHDSRNCNTQKNPSCKHCKTDKNHRSDSYRCPAYINEKNKLIRNG